MPSRLYLDALGKTVPIDSSDGVLWTGEVPYQDCDLQPGGVPLTGVVLRASLRCNETKWSLQVDIFRESDTFSVTWYAEELEIPCDPFDFAGNLTRAGDDLCFACPCPDPLPASVTE